MRGYQLRGRLRALEHVATVARQAGCGHPCHAVPTILDVHYEDDSPDDSDEVPLGAPCPNCGKPARAIRVIVVYYPPAAFTDAADGEP